MEIKNVAEAIKGNGGNLAIVMEMEYSLEAAKRDPNKCDTEYTLISDFVFYEEKRRYKLAEYLREAGYRGASRK